LNTKKRIINTISATEFFQHPKVKECYKFWKKVGKRKIYKLRDTARKIVLFGKKVFYIYWDARHNDIEALDKAGRHLGSINPVVNGWTIF